MNSFVNFFDRSFAYGSIYLRKKKKWNKLFFSSLESERFATNNFDAIYLKR